MAHNNLAWGLVLGADAPEPDRSEGLALARKAVELRPDEPDYLNTLALAG